MPAFRIWAVFVAALSTGCATYLEGPRQVDPPAIRAGDAWTYRIVNGYNGETKGTLRAETSAADGKSITLRLTRAPEGREREETYTGNWDWVSVAPEYAGPLRFDPPLAVYDFPLEVAKAWKRGSMANDGGRSFGVQVYGKVLGWERVSVPAGEFLALKLRRNVYLADAQWWRTGIRAIEYEWYAPEVRKVVKRSVYSEYNDLRAGRRNSLVRGDWIVYELAGYKLGALRP